MSEMHVKKHWIKIDSIDFTRAATDPNSFMFVLGKMDRIPFDVLKFDENGCTEREIWSEIEIH